MKRGLSMCNSVLSYTIRSEVFDEHYLPAAHTRLTTNFANLARGEQRQQNLRTTMSMINQRFNALVHWDNPTADRYAVALEIISVDLQIAGAANAFPAIEVLKTQILDRVQHKTIAGVVGNNFSSYLRDYDFSVRLASFNQQQSQFRVPVDFGDLHGQLFRHFIHSATYREHFGKWPVICLSVSDNKVYERSHNQHPVLGVEYHPTESSLTELYFQKMGLQVRYFMPADSVAPLAFYFLGDLLNDYSNLELASTISTMETFQKIYRPEIYNAFTPAGPRYQPSLQAKTHSLTPVVYDREERRQLAVRQGKYAEQHLLQPYQQQLSEWLARAAS